jgi:site-specific DNA-methyltransferase (adenine-specific)
MADFDKNRFASKKQDWETPDSIWLPLAEEFPFNLDVAASDKNHLLEQYITEEQDAMKTEWGSHVCWLNPPYGKGYPLSAWVKRGYEESKKGAIVVMLIPSRTNTNWFHEICLKHGEVRFLKGRPKFGGAKHGLPQPLCIVIFRPQLQMPTSHNHGNCELCDYLEKTFFIRALAPEGKGCPEGLVDCKIVGSHVHEIGGPSEVKP